MRGQFSIFGACLLAVGCTSPHVQEAPIIEFTKLPPAGEGSADILYSIAGRVKNAPAGQRLVLFARSGLWWVQPLADQPFTAIQPDSTWKSSTHPGTAYAALLVTRDYKPPMTTKALPERGGSIQAVAIAEGKALDQTHLRKLDFSGYEWLVRQTPASPAGTRNIYDPENAWVDVKGLLHLRIAMNAAGWTSASVNLSRSLGYGSYRFVVSDVSHFDSPVVLTISSQDSSSAYREMNIEISRWGEPSGKNAQYVVQPYYVPANVVRFLSPEGRLTYAFDWQPGRVAFRTVRGEREVVASHVFTSGVPPAGTETVGINFYVFAAPRAHLQHGAEVTIEKFEFLP